MSQLKLTKAGFIYTALTIFIGVSAVNTGNNFLYLLTSILLSFMWLSGLFARFNLRGVRVEIFSPKEAYAGKKTFLKMKLEKSKGWGFLYRNKVLIEYKGKLEEVFFRVPYLAREREIPFVFIPQRRGEYRVKEVVLSSLFPLGLFERRKKFPLNQSFVVFPEPKKCHLFEVAKRRRKVLGQEGKLMGREEFDSISDYISGISKKLIYWKALAKWDELKRKVFLEGESLSVIIDLSKMPFPGLEEKLSCATYLILKAQKEGQAVGLKLEKRYFPPGYGESHKIKLLTALSLYGETYEPADKHS